MKRLVTSPLCLILLVLFSLFFITQPSIASSMTEDQSLSSDSQEHEPIVLSGNGNGSEIIQVDFSPSRVILRGKNTEIQIKQGDLNASTLSTIDHYQDLFMNTMWPKGTLHTVIKSEGDWSLTIEPINKGGILPISGKGVYISDFIELTEPLEITFIADGSKLNRVSAFQALIEYPPKEDGSYSQPDVINWDVYTTTPEKPRYETNCVINAEGQNKEGVLFVFCHPEMEWSILVDGLPSPVTYAELNLGSRGQEVLDLKQRFFELGYFRTTEFSDQFNQNTADTVRLFEKNNGLPQDGVADDVMLGVLFSDKAVGK